MIFISSFNPFMTEADIIQKPVQNQWTGFYMISASVMKGLTMYQISATEY